MKYRATMTMSDPSTGTDTVRHPQVFDTPEEAARINEMHESHAIPTMATDLYKLLGGTVEYGVEEVNDDGSPIEKGDE